MTESRTRSAGPLRGGVIGFGFISSRGHVPAYASRKDLEIVAVADTCAARREAAKQALPNARIYETHRALLEGERGKIDFVDVTTPPCDHAKIARAALKQGLHVLCEKPLATTAEDARAMLAQARESHRVLYPCHNYKHAPVIKTVRRVLDSGEIGKVQLVTLQTFRNTHAKGVAEWRPHWRRERRYSGGGIAMDHGSHTFYLAFDWLGTYPEAITAQMWNDEGFDTEDNFACSIQFPNGRASAYLTWTAGVRKVIYTIHGERGAIRVEDDDVEVSVMSGDAQLPSDANANANANAQSDRPSAIVRAAPSWQVRHEKIPSDWRDASHVDWFASMLGNFVEAIDKGDFAGKEAQNSLRCVELIQMAYASAADRSREYLLANTG